MLKPNRAEPDLSLMILLYFVPRRVLCASNVCSNHDTTNWFICHGVVYSFDSESHSIYPFILNLESVPCPSPIVDQSIHYNARCVRNSKNSQSRPYTRWLYYEERKSENEKGKRKKKAKPKRKEMKKHLFVINAICFVLCLSPCDLAHLSRWRSLWYVIYIWFHFDFIYICDVFLCHSHADWKLIYVYSAKDLYLWNDVIDSFDEKVTISLYSSVLWKRERIRHVFWIHFGFIISIWWIGFSFGFSHPCVSMIGVTHQDCVERDLVTVGKKKKKKNS